MPLVVEFLLLDEDAALVSAGGRLRIPTGRGIFAEIERQIQDPNSHLRRKSALGALVTRGAAVRAVGEEVVEVQDVGVVHPVDCESLGLEPAFPASAASSSAPMPSPQSAADDGGSAVHLVASVAGSAKVPKISDFPKMAVRPRVVSSGGFGFGFESLFGWLPSLTSCSPVSCSSVPRQVVTACTIIVPDAESFAPCLLQLPDVPLESYEAGLGGWPLCIAQAFAALARSQPAGDSSSGLVLSPTQSVCLAPFRRVAVEVDDFDLTVVFTPQGALEPGCAVATARSVASTCPAGSPGADELPRDFYKDPRGQPTASTRASTSLGVGRSDATSPGGATRDCEVWPPPWVQHNRIVLSREGICSFQVWPASGNVCSLSFDKWDKKCCFASSAPWPHLVEVTGLPNGAPQPVTILLALPTAALASRVAEALSRVRHRSQSAPLAAAPARRSRSAVRCELQVNATLNLEGGINFVNCASVVRRGISEAAHVGADRVRICTVRDQLVKSEATESLSTGG